MLSRNTLLIVLPLMLLALSCNNEDDPLEPGQLTIQFKHLVNGAEIVYDNMQYVNAAGNEYEVTEIQWFVSDITLIGDDETPYLLDQDRIAWYVDTNLPETWQYAIPDDIIPGSYQSIKITFGIRGDKNIRYDFPNPPESNMIWPAHLGGDNGGYHYMKLNGFWMNTENIRTPFNFHIGVGPVYDEDNNVIRYEQNWFATTLPNSAFSIAPNESKTIALSMNVENWFQNPHVYDHNTYGGKIMNNQEAMRIISENGRDVFTVDLASDDQQLFK